MKRNPFSHHIPSVEFPIVSKFSLLYFLSVDTAAPKYIKIIIENNIDMPIELIP